MLYFAFLIPLVWHCATCESACEANGQLGFSKYSVEKNGIVFDRIAINRSIPVQVTYRITTASSKLSSVSWAHNGQTMKVEEGKSGEVFYKVDQQPGSFVIKLHIPAPTARVTGNWSLTVRTDDNAEHSSLCFIEAPPVIQARLGAVRANEGDALSVECLLESSPPGAKVTWRRIHETDGVGRLVPAENATFSSKDGVENAVMEWSDATHVMGFYLCTAESPRGSDSLPVEVRIKGKGVFIYPAVGIAIEIVILLISIIIYERHQAKRRKAEENRSFNTAGK